MDKRRSLEELGNISFNYEANHTNNTDTTVNSATLSLNQSGGNNPQNEDEQDQENVFDELAMLCSGQFRQCNEFFSIITKHSFDNSLG
jgi:hypothetical protein